MGKAINCPNANDPEMRLLVSEMENPMTAELDAYNIWVRNGGKYPDEIIAKVNNKVEFETSEETQTTREILNKQKTVEKLINIIDKKLNRLTAIEAKDDYIQHYQELLAKLKGLQTDAAIVEFIKVAEKIIKTGEKTIDQIEKDIKEGGKNSTYLTRGLGNINEFIGVFNILKNIQEDSINDPEFKSLLPLLNELIGKQNNILLKVKKHSTELISKDLIKYSDKILKYYKRKAEIEFNNSEIAKRLKGAALKTARQEYIENYINENKGLIEAKNRDFMNNILLNVEDVPYLTSLLSNPADINNPILSYAVDLLDRADFNVTKRINDQAEVFQKLHKDYTDYMGNKSNMEELYSPLLEKDSLGKLTGNYVNELTSKHLYRELKEGRYKGTPVETLYDEVIRLQKEKDKIIPKSSRLGYRLPSINKKFIERLYSENIVKTGKDSIVDYFKVNNTDTDLGEIEKREEEQKKRDTIQVITNEFGEEKQNIPIHYRGKTDLNKQSYDVLGISMLDLNNTFNYHEKFDVGIILSLLKENISDSDVIQRDWQDRTKVQKSGAIAPKKGVHSNIYKSLEHLIKHRVYGISVEGNPQTIKVINNMKSFTNALNLSLNPYSAGANFLQSTTMEWIESIGGDTGAFGRINRAHAYQKYTLDLPNMMLDANKHVPTSKSYLLARELQIGKLFNPKEKEFIENNIVKKVGVNGTLQFMNNAGETHVQTILMYSVLDNIKVLDKDGNFLDKNFNPTKDRSKAIGIDSAYTVENGKLTLNKKVNKTERTDGVTTEDIRKISKFYAKTSRTLFGNGDSRSKSIAQRNILGHLVFQMRSWLVPGFEKRFKGITKVGVKNEDLNIDQLEYNQEMSKFEEGMYTSTVRFLVSMSKDLRKLGISAAPENWKNLTTTDKANIYRTLAETTAIICALLVSKGLKDAYDDDKEDKSLLIAAYFSRRLYSEMFTYINPKETLRTFKSPAMILTTAENLAALIEQLADPTEEYTTGIRSGESKLKRKALKLTPVITQFNKNTTDMYNFLTR